MGKNLSALIFVLSMGSLGFAQSECPNLNGAFRGSCVEVGKDGATTTYDMLFEVQQKECEQISIKILTYPDEWYVMNHFDLNKGLIEMEKTEPTTIYSGGIFVDSVFAATLLYVNGGEVDTVYTQYEKVKKGNGDHLLIDQTSLGYRMTCDLPFVEVY